MLAAIAAAIWGVAGGLFGHRHRTKKDKRDEASLAFKALYLNTPRRVQKRGVSAVLKHHGIK